LGRVECVFYEPMEKNEPKIWKFVVWLQSAIIGCKQQEESKFSTQNLLLKCLPIQDSSQVSTMSRVVCMYCMTVCCGILSCGTKENDHFRCVHNKVEAKINFIKVASSTSLLWGRMVNWVLMADGPWVDLSPI
jgi:hypothetical protein